MHAVNSTAAILVWIGLTVVYAATVSVGQRRMLAAMKARSVAQSSLAEPSATEWSPSAAERKAVWHALRSGKPIEDRTFADALLLEYDRRGPAPDYSRTLRRTSVAYAGATVLIGLLGDSRFLLAVGGLMVALTAAFGMWIHHRRCRLANSIAATRRLHQPESPAV
jgi:hypothetical protein